MTKFVRLCLALILTGVFLAERGHAQNEKGQGRVMSWVPPYAVEACRKSLDQSFDGIVLKEGLTHLGLQFWVPTEDGGVKFVDRFKPIGDATVSSFRKWGEANGVKTMLCVYNTSTKGWDWELARSAFEKNRDKLVEVLVSETLRLKLDGVDIDFEGKGNRDKDREAFISFIKELSRRLREGGKELTVDTFAYKWHAPNQRWWAELLPHIDGLHVMGYSETGAGATDWRSYEFIAKAGGQHSSKLLLGVPSHLAKWQRKSAFQQVSWIGSKSLMGLAIWDLQLQAPEWRRRDIWEGIGKIKKGRKE
jgi:hypothetical protein